MTTTSNLVIQKAIESTFNGGFDHSCFLKENLLILKDKQSQPLVTFRINGNFLTESVFCNTEMTDAYMPSIYYTKNDIKLFKKAYSSFCSNDAIAPIIKSKGNFKLKEMMNVFNSNLKTYNFYDSSTLSIISLAHDTIIPSYTYYYSYNKQMILDNNGVFRTVLLLNFYLKRKTYSIYISPELNKAVYFHEKNYDVNYLNSLTFDKLFENSVNIKDLNKAIDPLWGYDIFFFYIDAVLKNRTLSDHIMDNCSTFKERMALVDMYLI